MWPVNPGGTRGVAESNTSGDRARFEALVNSLSDIQRDALAELDYPIHSETVVFAGRDQAAEWVQARNAHRRHSNPSQLAAALVKVNTWVHGGDRHSDEIKGAWAPLKTQQQAADENNISRDTLKRASKVEKKAPELTPLMRDGKLDAKTAAKVAPSAHQNLRNPLGLVSGHYSRRRK